MRHYDDVIMGGAGPIDRRTAMESMRSDPRTALVTGASSGIGLELANLLGADGCNLVLVGRNRTRMKELADKFQAEHHISAR